MTLNDQIAARVSTTSPTKDATEVYDAAHGRYQDAPMAVRPAAPPPAPPTPFASMIRR